MNKNDNTIDNKINNKFSKGKYIVQDLEFTIAGGIFAVVVDNLVNIVTNRKRL